MIKKTYNDHPIFLQSIKYIQNQLDSTGFDPLQQQVLERLIHTSGDFSIQSLLRFSPDACLSGLKSLQEGAFILTDTSMAKVGVLPMAQRTLNSKVLCVLDWAPISLEEGSTRTSSGMRVAWRELTENCFVSNSPVVLIGSSPTALNALLDLVDNGACPPSLVIGMPVGFVGVIESKKRLFNTQIPYISIDGSRGGSALSAATANALLRASIN